MECSPDIDSLAGELSQRRHDLIVSVLFTP